MFPVATHAGMAIATASQIGPANSADNGCAATLAIEDDGGEVRSHVVLREPSVRFEAAPAEVVHRRE